MPVTEIKQKLGSFQIVLSPTTPRDILDQLTYLGHIAIVDGRVDPVQYGDNLLTAARYVGVYRNRVNDVDNRSNNELGEYRLQGVGMAYWLGDEDGKGPILETAAEFSAATFANTIRDLLPDSVGEGILHSVAGTYSGRHQWVHRRNAIDYVTSTFSAEWRVNNDGTLDAGTAADLYDATPKAMLVKRGYGKDLGVTAYPGKIDSAEDIEAWTSRVVVLAQGEGDAINTGTADNASNPYLDLFGNPVVITKVVSESATEGVNATVRAGIHLAETDTTRRSMRLATDEYILDGDLTVGEWVYVFDPDTGLYDLATEIAFRGQRINPAKFRCTEMTWPVQTGTTVAYRTPDGDWIDLTDHVNFEDEADTSIVIGDLPRMLSGGGTEPIGSRPSVDTSTPAAPAFVTPFQTATYLDGNGFSRSRMLVEWQAPLNQDGSTVLDGDHYDIRWAVDTDFFYPATWAQVSQIRWVDMQTWGQPFAAPDEDWQYMIVGWDQTTALVQDLSTGVGYDFQIRAVDRSGNASPWSGTIVALAEPDNIPPSTPAPPEVAASRIAIQVIHHLGRATGGVFNLEQDIERLDIYIGDEPGFTPIPGNTRATVTAGSAGTTSTLPATDADAADVFLGDRMMLFDSGNVLKEQTVFTIDDELSSGGTTTVTITPPAQAAIAAGDYLQGVGNQVGRLKATGGMVSGSIPAVGTFQVEEVGARYIKVVAVDQAGNASAASAAAQATAELIDDAHISDLSVSKVTAGTITADWILGASIKTGLTGPRVELSNLGIEVFNQAGTKTVDIDADDGSVEIVGTFSSGPSPDRRLVVNPPGVSDPEIRFYDDAAEYHYITSFSAAPNTIQIGSVHDGSDNKAILNLDPAEIYLGIFNDTGSGSQRGFRITSGDELVYESVKGWKEISGGGFSWHAQSGPGDGYFRSFWNGSNIQFVRNDTNAIVKTFVIDHPNDPDRWLVHATTESPHNGVEYWGTVELDEDGLVEVALPDYFEQLTRAEGRAVFLSTVDIPDSVAATYPKEGQFTISGTPGRRVNWLVKAVRVDVPELDAEPLRADVVVNGDGPYRYLTPTEKP